MHFFIDVMNLLMTCPDKTAGHSWPDSQGYSYIHDNQGEVRGMLALS